MQALTFVFAFVVVLALIGVAAWLVRRFAGNRLGANTNRGRMPRLAVIDAAAVDGRRRLVLVRRDNVEHLLMIGGPTDIVVEPNIVRAIPGRDQMPQRAAVGPRRTAAANRAAARRRQLDRRWTPGVRHVRSPRTANARAAAAAGAALLCRRSAPPGAGAIGAAQRARRSQRSVGWLHAGAAWRPPGTAPRVARRTDAVAGDVAQRTDDAAPAAAERAAEGAAGSRAERSVASPPPPPPPPPPSAPSPAISTADQNLAEMAQRLEAALRRPAGDAGEPRIGAPPVAPEPPRPQPAPRRTTDGAAGGRPLGEDRL